MLAEAAALITLHCATQVSGDAAMGNVGFTVTVDYDRNYAYLNGDRRYFEPLELSNVTVTPGQIRLPRRAQNGVIYGGGTISRTDGAVNVILESAFFNDSRGNYQSMVSLQGKCSPGPLVQPPTPAF